MVFVVLATVASVAFSNAFVVRRAVVLFAVRIFGILILLPAAGTYPTVFVPSDPNRRTPPVDAQQTFPRTASVAVELAATKDPAHG